MLPFRILKYIVAIMNHHVEITKTNELPFVYPMILYTGRKPYKTSLDIFNLFSQSERELAKETLLAPYQLIDLTQISDEELEQHLWYGTMARVHKHIHDPCVNPFIKNIVQVLQTLEDLGEKSYIYTTISYLKKVATTSNKEELIQSILKLDTVDEEILMTLEDHIKKEYFEKCRNEGLEIGREKGRQRADKKAEKKALKK